MPISYLDTFNIDAFIQVRTDDGRLLGCVPRVDDGIESVLDSNGAPHPIWIVGTPAVVISDFSTFKLSDLPGFQRYTGAPSDAELARTVSGKDTDTGEAP